jgi:hypothetical protein
MERFTQNELDHLFAAMLLHTKTTREEQAAWVTETRPDLAKDRRGFRRSSIRAYGLPDESLWLCRTAAAILEVPGRNRQGFCVSTKAKGEDQEGRAVEPASALS